MTQRDEKGKRIPTFQRSNKCKWRSTKRKPIATPCPKLVTDVSFIIPSPLYRIRHRTMALCVQPISASLLREGNDSCTPLLHACSLLASHGVRACAYGCIRRRVTTNIGRENFNVSTAFNPSRGLLRWSPLIAMRNHFQPMNHPLERSTCRLFASSVFRHPRETDISAIRMQRRTRWTSISSSNASIQVEIFLPSTFFSDSLFLSSYLYFNIV